MAALLYGSLLPSFAMDKDPYQPSLVDGRKQLQIALSDTSDTELVVRLAGLRFVIPVIRLDNGLVESLQQPGELNRGFTMVALLPDFTARSEDNLQDFYAGAGTVDRIRILADRLCIVGGCAPSVRSALSLDALWGETVPAGSAEPTPEGLSLFAHLVEPDPAQPTGTQVRSDVFDVTNGNDLEGGRTQFIVCDAPNSVPVPHCTHQFAWQDRIWIKLSYKRDSLPQWRQWWANTVKLMGDLSSASPGAASRTVFFPGGPE